MEKDNLLVDGGAFTTSLDSRENFPLRRGRYLSIRRGTNSKEMMS